MFAVRREYAVEAGEVESWARNQGRQAGNEIEGIQDDVRCAVAKGLLERVNDLTALVGGEPLVGNGGAGDVATELFELVALVRLAAGCPMQGKAGLPGEQRCSEGFRLQQGREAKVKRGELGRCLAPGYVMDATGRIVKDPNLRVQEAMALVFKRFGELGSIRQTHRWFHEERIELPVNKPIGGHRRLAWQLPTVSFIGDVLHNPLYGGAYVYGRRPVETVLEAGQGVKRRQASPRAAEEARVFLPDRHRGYIDWDTYQRYQDVMRGNGGNFRQDETALAVRRGQGLLTGLLRCGRCGRKLPIRYWGKSGTAARYVCVGDFATGGRYCLGFGGATVDKRIGALIVKVISPRGLDASIAAIERSYAEGSDRRGALQRQVQQVRYEAERAFTQYDQVDPTNRLVAEVLEQRWNAKLDAMHDLEGALEALALPHLKCSLGLGRCLI